MEEWGGNHWEQVARFKKKLFLARFKKKVFFGDVWRGQKGQRLKVVGVTVGLDSQHR